MNTRENKNQINEKPETKLFEVLTNIYFIRKQHYHILPNACTTHKHRGVAPQSSPPTPFNQSRIFRRTTAATDYKRL